MQIGKFIIKKTGVYTFNVDKASHSHLRWCLQTITRLGNESEQARAKEILSAYEGLLNENKIIDNDKHMEEYRRIENKFFEEWK